MSGGVESGAGSHAGEDPAIGDATLADGNPARHKLIGCWINDGLARTEKKTNSNKQDKSARDAPAGTSAVKAVKIPHQTTPAVKTRRGP